MSAKIHAGYAFLSFSLSLLLPLRGLGQGGVSRLARVYFEPKANAILWPKHLTFLCSWSTRLETSCYLFIQVCGTQRRFISVRHDN